VDWENKWQSFERWLDAASATVMMGKSLARISIRRFARASSRSSASPAKGVEQ
jgi:hypothetical protein